MFLLLEHFCGQWTTILTHRGIEEDILKASAINGDPYKEPFRASDLGLASSDYGSISDHCSKKETVSGKWSPDVILKVAQKDKSGRPSKYLLK